MRQLSKHSISKGVFNKLPNIHAYDNDLEDKTIDVPSLLIFYVGG
jgi:hypothetical protein